MNDMDRLLARDTDADGAAPELRRLLRAADGDPGLSASARAKIASLAPVPSGAIWHVPWRVVGLCVGLAALGGGILTAARPTRHVEAAPALAAVNPPPPVEIPTTAATPISVPPVTTIVKPSVPTSVRAAATSAPKATLADEVKALDLVRAALGRGDGAVAIVALDVYGRSFPHGLLAQEATVLRVEALLMQGDRTSATRIGHAFLATSPNSPYATRMRTLLGE